MQDEPLVSIVVPCYNVEQYLPKCLKSLVNQTYKNIEIIAVNDGSPDHCSEILHTWEAKYPSLLTVIDKQNEGLGAARWDGVAAAHGQYITFLDSDDYADPEFVACLTQAMTSSSDVDMVVCGFARTDLATGKILSHDLCGQRESFYISQDPGRLVEINPAPWNKLFRTETLKHMHHAAIPRPIEDIVISWLAYLDMRGKVVFVPKPLVNYMVRSSSAMGNITTEQVSAAYDSFIEMKEIYLKEQAAKPLLDAFDLTAFVHLGISLNARLATNPSCDIKSQLARCTTFLDTYFPSWSSSPYLSREYVNTHGDSYHRIKLAASIYKHGLMAPFLRTYNAFINLTHHDVKW